MPLLLPCIRVFISTAQENKRKLINGMHNLSLPKMLEINEVEQAADVIARAFINDPLIQFMVPIKATRLSTLKKFFRAFGQISIKNKHGFGVGEPLQGVAYWKFPDQANDSISVKSLGIFLPLLLTFYPIGLFRARKIVQKIDELHVKYADQPHFYLDNLGVLPSAQGQGLASKLIRPFLDLADEQKVVSYTDTVTKKNVPFYEHFGFECVEEAEIPATGITVWALRRPIH